MNADRFYVGYISRGSNLFFQKLTKQTYATLTTPSAAPPIAPEPAPQPIASSSKPKRGLPVHLKSLAADPRAAKGLRVKKETAFEEEAKKAKKSSVWKTLKNRLDKVVGKKDKAYVFP